MKRLLALLAAVAAGVALAGVYLPSNAATVGGAAISRQALDRDLSAIAASPDYACFLSEEREVVGTPALSLHGAGSGGTGDGTFDTAFVDDWLASMITDRIAAQVVASRHLAVSTQDMAEARGALTRRITDVLRQYATVNQIPSAGCGGSGSAVLASMPGWFVTQASQAEADQAVLDARAVGAGLSAPQIADYYARHRSTFDKACLSIIVVRTRTAALKASSAIAGGTAFSQEAESVSLTSGTGSAGGAAGCGLVTGTFLAPHVSHLAVGQVSAPFSARGVWWLATITSRSTLPLSNIRGSVVTAMLQAGQSHVNAELRAALGRTGVVVDARYGTTAHGPTLIAPPALPPSDTLVSGAANAPTPTTAG